MSKNVIVISCELRETRVALIENGIIAELHIERRGHPNSGSVGNVILGKVTRVLPGLQAAFVDVGQERAAFLHVEDLIRPDDFEAYLAGGRKHALQEERPGADDLDEEEPATSAADAAEGHASRVAPDSPTLADLRADALEAGELIADTVEVRAPEGSGVFETEVLGVLKDAARTDDGEGEALAPDDLEELSIPGRVSSPFDILRSASLAPGRNEGDALDEADTDHSTAEPLEDEDDADEEEADEAEGHSHEDLDEHPAGDADDAADVDVEPAAESVVELTSAGATAPKPGAGEAADEDDLAGDDLPGFTVSEPGEPVPRAAAPARADRGGRRRRRGRGRNEPPAKPERPAPAERGGGAGGGGGRGTTRGRRDARSGGGGGGGGGGGVPSRISKSTPIREVVKEGQDIIVQITKEPIGTKGARCSSHISLPGRYVVYLPTVDHIGVSKRIGSEKERARLRDAIEGMKPPSGGLIVRTVAEGLTKKQLKADVGYLVRLWGEVAKKRESARSPSLLASELDLVLKTARDLFTDEVAQVVVDDRNQYERLCRFVEMFAPERIKDIIYYNGEEPIFDAYGIEDEIGRALSRKVPLPSGGYLIIDQAEALTAIDVNTGRFVGKGSKDMEETILKTNLEAVNEIAYQLRFRNIGGLIILDLIDMERPKNRELVRRTLDELLQKDKAKTTLNRISELGLIEMTRKRTRESLGRLLHEPCFYCDGTGQLQSKETIAYEILREIRRKRADLPGYTVLVNAHPAVADLLTGAEKLAVAECENRYMRKITVVPRKDYHLEQFDLTGK